MKKQSLNGIWRYRIGKGKWREREVPFSALAVGHSECEKEFDLEYEAPRVELKLDGITYGAKIFLNGELIGDMLPYCEYAFDITDKVRCVGNLIHVELEDISPAFGPVAGWENFGGIIRDVYITYTEREYIKGVTFTSELFDGYRRAVCKIDIDSVIPHGSEELCGYEISIKDGADTVFKTAHPSGEHICEFELSEVKLWSPDEPNLYKMQIKLVKNGKIIGGYEEKIGIREIKCDRHRFLFNGEPIFLKGVCKHEMIGDLGHTVNKELVMRDMLMIKSLGCNFVRLVHYPHARCVLDIADEIGIMVSEEPGLWWSDTSNKEIADSSIEVLRRTIIRDRNHPSIAFWLCFNECRFTEDFLLRSAKMCKQSDPTRLVSGANCMSDEDTYKYFNECGFDFYTMHPYSQTFDRSWRAAKVLFDKPLVFTEWGGHFVYDNPKLMREFIMGMRKLYESNSDKGSLAGAFLWCFAEVNDFNREKPAVRNGRLLEGLVDYDRNPRMCFEVFKNAWDYECDDGYSYKIVSPLPQKTLPVRYVKGGVPYRELKSELYEKPKPDFFEEQRPRVIKHGPVCENTPTSAMDGEPKVIKYGDSALYSASIECDGIILLGGTDAVIGYPLFAEYGDSLATVSVEFDGGEKSEFTLRNGMEITTVYSTYRSSRIDPIASEAERFMEFSYDGSFERYVMNKRVIPFSERRGLKSVTLKGIHQKCALLNYAVLGYQN